MDMHTLDQLYREGAFKEGNSRKADEAIARLMDVLRHPKDGRHFSGFDFNAAWQELLKTLLSEFPNISLYNLVGLQLPLTVRGLHEENLVLYRFAVELNPQSCESQCFLGHAYRHVGDLESAAVCYKHAYELTMSYIAEHKVRLSNPIYLDACDYLCHLAEAESELRRRADALVHTTLALSILNKTKAEFKKSRVYNVIYRICLSMDLDDLAEHYRLQAVESERKNPS